MRHRIQFKKKSGAITFMIGGEEDAIEEAMPVLKCLSAHQFRMGKIGNGHVAKTLNNYVSAASVRSLGKRNCSLRHYASDCSTFRLVPNSNQIGP